MPFLTNKAGAPGAGGRRALPPRVPFGAIDLATPSGRLVARQLGAVARYEIEHAIERQKSAKLQAAKAGKYGGGMRPYGYKGDGVTIGPVERDVLLEMAERIIGED